MKREADFAVLHTELTAFSQRSLQAAGWKANALAREASHPLPLLFLSMVARAQASRFDGWMVSAERADALKAVLLEPMLSVLEAVMEDEEHSPLAALEQLAGAVLQSQDFPLSDTL